MEKVDGFGSRQAMIEGLCVPKTVSIVGVGGVGTWAALFCTLAGVEHLRLFDLDCFADHNLERVPLPGGVVGQPKTVAVTYFLQELRPDINVFCAGGINEGSLDLLEGTVLCCTDNLASQRLVFQYCKEKKLPFMRMGYDGNHLTVQDKVLAWGEGTFDGYTVPSWGPPAAIAAGLGVYAAFMRKPFSFVGDLEDIGNGDLRLRGEEED